MICRELKRVNLRASAFLSQNIHRPSNSQVFSASLQKLWSLNSKYAPIPKICPSKFLYGLPSSPKISRSYFRLENNPIPLNPPLKRGKDGLCIFCSKGLSAPKKEVTAAPTPNPAQQGGECLKLSMQDLLNFLASENTLISKNKIKGFSLPSPNPSLKGGEILQVF